LPFADKLSSLSLRENSSLALNVIWLNLVDAANETHRILFAKSRMANAFTVKLDLGAKGMFSMRIDSVRNDLTNSKVYFRDKDY
jgi:hypothetical protein